MQDLLRAFIPIEDLVSEAYAKWRPVVRDGFSFIGARLAPERLVPKLVEQLALPAATPVEGRVMAFIRRVPSLQKIAQTVARNRNLDPEFRARLADLEDGIREVGEAEIRAEIDQELGDRLSQNQVQVEPGLLAEGSVSAVMRFTRVASRPGEPSSGVFKVLKPFITRYFQEDLTLLGELADYFNANQKNYDLDKLDLRAMLFDVRELFERETDFVHERANLAAAATRSRDLESVRVPVPIESLSSDTITAMTEEQSVKVTDAYPHDPRAQIVCAD